MIRRDDSLCVRSQVVLGVLLVAWWLIWDVAVCGLGWVVGWPVWRTLSLGSFPRCSVTDQASIGAAAALVVHATGLMAVSAFVWWLWMGHR